MRSAPTSRAVSRIRAAGHHDPEVDHLVVVAAQHDPHDVLADVVDVALDGGHHDRAGRARRRPAAPPRGRGSARATAFFITRALFTTWGRNILPAPNRSPTMFMPAMSGPSITSRGRAASQPGLLGVLRDVRVEALDQRVGQALVDRQLAPREVVAGPGHGRATRVARGDLQQPVRGVRAPVEDDVLDALEQVGVDVVVLRDHARR